MRVDFILVALSVLASVLITQGKLQPSQHEGQPCQELNQINCYTSFNEGYLCNRKDPSSQVTRWFYDKGDCKTFTYKGCYGNRNRFCTKESCLRRCKGNL